ncbi:unnamed protein product [Brugia timori]|uniref:Uncharacterized protein n=1 Tax=Brugia timori TaxID=42155 RepID=A0A3P7WAL8_9BILA|nr:unnamed protein product [Brugia timori]
MGKINMYPPIINQHVIHFEVSIFATLDLFKFNESILQ